ncbi:mechanosensitive ion channel [Thalassococcus sp. CAU 1522]|uniref:Small-conductance mechanosensitive channel n=1 Tax=Thalassococcus arenae TaxID=2851652 RepID=A0ABS6N620_9RHOB|nr:mechanosensitive ion channel domain-containing protein [Thalassococcus arenae]MBV2358965.1 mechanosensitive ion channel [Thalassococcus arenae]
MFETIDTVMQTEIYGGKAIADLLTLEFLAALLGDVLAAIVILLLGLAIGGWLKRRVTHIGQRHAHLDNTLFGFLGNVVRYIAVGFALLFVLNTFGVETTSIVAAIGAAGLAIGLALQGTLSNVAAGVMIVLFRPIKLGDFVEVAGKTGTVQDINLNTTTLASLGNTQIIIPNSEVWGNVIENYSVYDRRRAEWVFGVGYGADLAKAEQVIRDTIMADDRSHADPEPFVQVNNLGASSVDFLVRVWVDSSAYFQYQADMKRRVKEALDREGIDIPFPTRTLHVERDAGAAETARDGREAA